MRTIKFKLLFDGHESELEARSFAIGETGVEFTIDALQDINNLRPEYTASEFDELLTYYTFPGFSLYYIQEGKRLYIVLYRDYQQRHQLYERGYFDLQ